MSAFLASNHPAALGGFCVSYSDKSGRRPRRPLKRRAAPKTSGLDDAKIRYILQIAEANPKFTADEVYAEIYYVRHRHDITKAVVRTVLAGRTPSRSFWPFRRR
ncbi:hypothetical protein [Actinoplanes awajinensis]|uniref:hypothetical protein n=1 Tax=Actinoplanes awajinensis TaxID=135946 RepID=UPI0012F73723|nr:hypothetical protein [Actinoplanes awajinensis]